MRVLFADRLPDEARVRLASGGFEVRAEPGLADEALREAMASFEPHVLVVRSTRVRPEHVAAGDALALIVRAGAGVNTIDLDACSDRGVYVANCPGKNAVAVAELTLGLLIALDRRIPDNVADFRAGHWNKATYADAEGLAGRTLGILGLGGIGTEVARRARAFQMKVVAWSRSLTDERAEELGILRAETPEQVARQSDALTVHLALTPQTAGFVGSAILQSLPRGAFFINTARAGIVDDDALRRALDEQGLWVALDVPPGEPSFKQGDFDHPLAGHPRVYVTHHIGASTRQAQMAVADEACRIVEGFRDRGRVDNAVNVAESTGADRALVVRHLDRVGVLAGVLDVLRDDGINVEEMENTIFAGGGGAVARVSVRGALSDDLLDRIRAQNNVLAVTAMDPTDGG